MSNPRCRRVLISITSYSGLLSPDGTNTGPFYIETLYPYEFLTKAGFELDLASETRTYGLDELSLTEPFLNEADKAVFYDPQHPFDVKLTSLHKASDIQNEAYDLFLASAGHAALYDSKLPRCDCPLSMFAAHRKWETAHTRTKVERIRHVLDRFWQAPPILKCVQLAAPHQ
jgi:hypothetical protein